MRNKKGFSLVELLVVSSIIGLLAVAGFVSYTTISKQSRDARRKADLEQIRQALELYRSDNDYYPDNTQGLTILTAPVVYLNSIPSDPSSGRNYSYNASGTPPTNYSLCTSLETGSGGIPSGCSSCGVACNYKLNPLGKQ